MFAIPKVLGSGNHTNMVMKPDPGVDPAKGPSCGLHGQPEKIKKYIYLKF